MTFKDFSKIIAALFATIQLAAVPIADKIFADKVIVQVFEKPYLLATANKLTAAVGSISTNCCLLNICFFAHMSSVVVFAINTIDC